MIELLQHATSNIFVFIGYLILLPLLGGIGALIISSIGWAINAVLVGFRGVKVKS